MNEFVRDAAIQRFEFAFELLWKSLKTYTEEGGVEVFSPHDNLHAGFQLGTIQEHQEWFRMLEDRNLTSHAYNEVTAESIYSRLAESTQLVRTALDELKKRG